MARMVDNYGIPCRIPCRMRLVICKERVRCGSALMPAVERDHGVRETRSENERVKRGSRFGVDAVILHSLRAS